MVNDAKDQPSAASLQGEGRAMLTMLAHVTNPTVSDWNDVELHLVASDVKLLAAKAKSVLSQELDSMLSQERAEPRAFNPAKAKSSERKRNGGLRCQGLAISRCARAAHSFPSSKRQSVRCLSHLRISCNVC